MIYYGYILIPHDTYFQWRENVNGNGYDVDSSYGCQCWDLAAEFWYNVGFARGYPHTGPNHYAYECWTVSREENKGSKFDLITNYEDILTGDIIVFNGTTSNPAGHIAFANEDYSTPAGISILGQNQGGTPVPAGGAITNITTVSLANFLGAFRYRAWHSTPHPTFGKSDRFPWVLYAKKLRNKRQNML